MRIPALAALLTVNVAFADAIYKGAAGYVRISDAPCTHPRVLVLLQDQWKPKFKQGWMMHRGRQLQLCWIAEGDFAVVVDEEGDAGRIPFAQFKREDGV